MNNIHPANRKRMHGNEPNSPGKRIPVQLKTIISKDDFLNILIDCEGYSEEDAIEEAEEYGCDLTDWIADRGGGEEQIEEALGFINNNKIKKRWWWVNADQQK